jgi:hypothetical protein
MPVVRFGRTSGHERPAGDVPGRRARPTSPGKCDDLVGGNVGLEVPLRCDYGPNRCSCSRPERACRCNVDAWRFSRARTVGHRGPSAAECQGGTSVLVFLRWGVHVVIFRRGEVQPCKHSSSLWS